MPRRLVAGVDDALFAEAVALVAGRSGMVFAPNRRMEAEGGLARAMKRAGVADPGAYLTLIRGDLPALDDLVDELTVGETHFMRDPDQIDLIRRELLPGLRQRRGGAPARVWSAGCATGEEAYSLAILLEEEGMEKGALVLGTDLSPGALAKARVASYSDWSMRGVSAQFLSDYFRHVGKRRILVDRIRQRVRFERLNLVGPEDYAAAGAGGMDLILCRNVLIYFDRQTVAGIAKRLFDCLAEGGVLVTAGADPLLGEYAPFEVDVTRVGIVYRRPHTLPARGAHSRSVTAAPPSWTLRGSLTRKAELPGPSAAKVGLELVGATPKLRPGQPQAAERAGFTPASVAGGLAGATSHPPAQQDQDHAFAQVVALANEIGAFEADVMAQTALRRHPLDAHLHYLRATLLLSLDRGAEAEEEAKRSVYLDPSLAVAHFLLGTILRARGARSGAMRSFRNARDLCASRPSDEEVPAGGGERTSALHFAACAEMARLEVAVVG